MNFEEIRDYKYQILEHFNYISNLETKKAYANFLENEFESRWRTPASIKQHHSVVGGWIIHTCEVMNIACTLFNEIPAYKKVEISDVIIAAFIHDLDKFLVRYVEKSNVGEPATEKQKNYAKDLGIRFTSDISKNALKNLISKKLGKTSEVEPEHGFLYNNEIPKMNDDGWVAILCSEYHLPINRNILSAVALHHGGWSNLKAEMNPLATLIHSADIMSSFYQHCATFEKNDWVD